MIYAWSYYKYSNLDVFHLVAKYYNIDFWSIDHISRKERKAYLLDATWVEIPEEIDLT